MAERRMSLAQRRICECLQKSPGLVQRELAKKLGITVDGIKKTVRLLVADGYVKRGRRDRKGEPLSLTGKPFPPSSECIPTHVKRQLAIDIGMSALLPAMRAMVAVGRAAA
ncbi:winged helix-turn-helix domain-containing protein [Burkholderia ubonensis]|uniref:winged helix-turn-helix domain-containing protein n=1 Tax=Burkholderia ubonensis TaxID=101571 RepID=UPI0009B33184|nr:winged helix-turn-helix domain-containing protein [Burkholderia ubonensis]